MTEKEFIEEVKKLGIEVTDGELNLLDNFYNLLIEWNQKINLTRITEKKEVYLKHFFFFLTIIKIVDLNNASFKNNSYRFSSKKSKLFKWNN